MSGSQRNSASVPGAGDAGTPPASGPRSAKRHGVASRIGDRAPGGPAPALPGLEPGALIGGKYRLVREVGKGGMGAVWAAVHESIGLEVAVKFLQARGDDQDALAERFIAEARMAAAIKHRFVVDVFDFGTTEHGVPYMVLELLEGGELADRMAQGPPLQVRDAVRFVAQCLSGLDAVHRAGVVHRDLKPENLFLISDSDGVFPKLLDFGIARMNVPQDETPASAPGAPARTRRLTEAGVAVGTPCYMAPEQLRARDDLDARADVYAMGVILFELLVGRVPFDGDNAADLLAEIITHEPPRLAELRPELGKELSDVLARALSREREQRFASATQMRDALNRVAQALPDALTVVQNGSAAQGPGQFTQLLMQSAKDPFAAASPTPLAVLQGRRKWLALGLVALALVGAIVLLARRGDSTGATRAPSANAPQPVAAPPAQASSHTPPAPAAPPVAQQPAEPAVTAPPGPAPRATKAVPENPSPRARRANGARHLSRPAASAGTRSGSAHKPNAHPPKKLYRNLDF